jgi:hypothetical protein
MLTKLCRVVALLLAVGVARLQAAPPTLTDLNPRGFVRGKPVVVTVTGANLTSSTRLVLPFAATQSLVPDAKPNPAQVKIQVTVDPTIAVGAYPVRIVTDEGVSALAFVAVDVIPTVAEIEDNNTFEKAQSVVPPVVIQGTCGGGDVDFYKFAAKKGQRLVIETEAARLGSGVVPQLRLTDSRRRFVAADDSQRLRGDARIILVAPADGEYVLEFSDTRYRGGNPPFYRIKVADYDLVDEVFPLGGRRGETVAFTVRGSTLSGESRVVKSLSDPQRDGTELLGLDTILRPGLLAPRVAVGDLPERLWIKNESKDPKGLDLLLPITVNSRLERAGDVDRFQFAVQPGQRYRIAVDAESLGSALDGVLRVTDAAGTQLALVDDVTLPAAPGQAPLQAADPVVDLTVPPGVTLLGVELRDQRHRGGIGYVYRLTVTPAQPDYELLFAVGEVNVPKGGAAEVPVVVLRRGYVGPLQLVIPNLAPGLVASGGHVIANGTQGSITLAAAANAPQGVAALSVEGRATDGTSDVRRLTERHVVLSNDVNVPAAVLRLGQVAVGISPAEALAVQGPAKIEVVQGFTAALPVTVTRGPGQEKLAIEVTAAPGGLTAGQPAPPNSLTAAPAPVAAGTSQVALTITAPLKSETGPHDLAIRGKARVGNVDQVALAPAVVVQVVRPFEVAVPPTLALTPGQTVILKGQVKRQPVFKEPVTLQVAGLPAGVTLATPLTPVAGGDFQIALKVDAKAAPASAALTLTASTAIAGMAYALPAVTTMATIGK